MKVFKEVIYTLVAAIMWGSLGVVFKLGLNNGASQAWMIFGRPFFASIVIIAFMLMKRESPTKWSVLVGGLGLAPLYVFYFLAVKLIGAALASVLLYTAPLWVTLLSPLMTGERLRIYDVIHVILGFLGTWLVLTEGSLSIKLCLRGAILGVLSGVSYATYILLARYAQLRGANVLEVGFYSIPIAAIGVSLVIHPRKVPTTADLAFALYLAVIGTIIPYILNSAALRKIRAPLVSVMSLVEPLTAVTLSITVLGEKLTATQVLGSVLVIGSVASSAFYALKE